MLIQVQKETIQLGSEVQMIGKKNAGINSNYSGDFDEISLMHHLKYKKII